MDIKKRDRSTKKQLNMMIGFIEENPSMVYPSNEASQYDSFNKNWETLTELLNSTGGTQKTLKQWKTVFTDLKSNAKKKMRKLKIDQQGTGGGPSTAPKLTELDERIIQLIKPVVVEGLPVKEAGIIIQEEMAEENADTLTFRKEKENVSENIPEPETSISLESIPGPIRSRRRYRTKFQNLSDPNLLSLVQSNYAIARAINNIAKALYKKK